MRKNLYLLILLTLAAVGLALAPHLILGAPNEPSMGFVQKIFYFHVPIAFVTFVAAFLCAGGSLAFLFRGSERGDRLAAASAELAALFGLLVLLTGPLWARKAWGKWWEWDVRITTTLVLWLVFLAYLFTRRYGGPGARKLAAGLAIFAAADVPLIYLSVSIWRTIHPKATVIKTLDPAMRPAFYVSLVAILALFLALLELRLRLERARARLDALTLAVEDHLDSLPSPRHS